MPGRFQWRLYHPVPSGPPCFVMKTVHQTSDRGRSARVLEKEIKPELQNSYPCYSHRACFAFDCPMRSRCQVFKLFANLQAALHAVPDSALPELERARTAIDGATNGRYTSPFVA
jgi:hypothetical protein